MGGVKGLWAWLGMWEECTVVWVESRQGGMSLK